MDTGYTPTLRKKILARRNNPVEPAPLDIPLTGIIAPDIVAEIHLLASAGQAGDNPARDLLYASFRQRLGRMGYVLRPWPNTPQATGIWDRDDVDQEGWIVFAELLDAWDGESHFVKYLFARYPWRLRDRILRGIGKPLPPIGETQLPEFMLATSIYAPDEEQPESALMASGLLEQIINNALGISEIRSLQSPTRRSGKGSSSKNRPEQARREA